MNIIETSKRFDGPTPNGGAYSVSYYYDKKGRPCGENKASCVHIHEYDENDNLIMETVGYLSTKKLKTWQKALIGIGIICGVLLLGFVILIIVLMINPYAGCSSLEDSTYEETTTSVYEIVLEVENGMDDTVDIDTTPIPISLSSENLNNFESYLSSVDVDYDFEDAYNIENAIKIYNENTINAVKKHSHDIRVNGNLDANALYDLVKKNNKEYLTSKEEYMRGFYEEYSNREIKKICAQICEAIPAIAEKDPSVDIDTACCYLYNLVILKSSNTSFDLGGFTMDNRFYMNYDMIENLKIGIDSDDPELTTFYHEMMHAFQFACDDMKKQNEDRMGIVHIYNDELEINPFSWYWLLEASAEMNMSQHLGVRYSTYKSRITYIDTLNFISNISSGEHVIQTEKLSFQRDTSKLFEQLDMTSDNEMHEVIKMMFNIEILQEENRGFYDWYNEEYNVDLSNDDGEKTYLRLTVKEDSLLTLTKIFYRNLARQINQGNATLQDAYFLMRVMEADLDRHFSNYDVGYMLFFHNFYDSYVEIQDEFFRLMASENNLSIEELIDGFENYSMNTTSKSPNYDLNFLSKAKKDYIADEFVNSFYKKGFPSMRNCQSQVEDLSKTISIEEMVENRLLR